MGTNIKTEFVDRTEQKERHSRLTKIELIDSVNAKRDLAQILNN